MIFDSASAYDSTTRYGGAQAQTWNAWGRAWGRAWGTTWGPLAGVIQPPKPDFIPGGSRPQRDARKPRNDDDEALLLAVLL